MVALWLGKVQSMPLSAKNAVSSCSLMSWHKSDIRRNGTSAYYVHFIELVSCDGLVGDSLAQTSNITRQDLSFPTERKY